MQTVKQSTSGAVIGSFIFLYVAYFRHRNAAYIDRQKFGPM